MGAPNERNPAGGPGFEREHRSGQAIHNTKYSTFPPACTCTARHLCPTCAAWHEAIPHINAAAAAMRRARR